MSVSGCDDDDDDAELLCCDSDELELDEDGTLGIDHFCVLT